MKTALKIFLCLVAVSAFGQPTITKTLPVQQGQTVSLSFDYPNLIRVSTWDKNEVSVEAAVNINGGENNDAFHLDAKTSGSRVEISNTINIKSLPHRITVKRDGQKIVFKDKAAFRKYQEESGTKFDWVNEGVDMEIVLDIKVPANTETLVESTYGMVEINNFSGPLRVKSTYGGIDATLNESGVGELKAETNYGHIYSGLDMKVSSENVRDEDFHTVVSARPGKGPRMSFESPYGNVYLRKK